MARKKILTTMFVLLTQVSFVSAERNAMVLTLQQAEALALKNDVRLLQAEAEVAASKATETAAGQLPDPVIKLAAMNLPTDSFDLGQEAMTNLQVGIRQNFPAGETLRKQQAKAQAQTRVQAADIPRLRAEIMRELRLQWLAAWAGQAEQRLLQQQRQVLQSLIPAVKGAYRAGRGNQSDVARIRLRIARLMDESAKLQGGRDAGLAGLSRWGVETESRLPEDLPAALTEIPVGMIGKHPELQLSEAQVAVLREQIELDRQAYKPAWGVEASYGWRENRADLFSVGVSLTLPVFAEKRQDPRLAASRKKYLAAREAVRDTRIRLETEKSRNEAEILALQSRIRNYRTEIIPQLKTLKTLARAEYRSGRSGFGQVLQAEEDLIEAQRSVLRLQVERARKIIALRYLLEDASS